MSPCRLQSELASQLARNALEHVAREYPSKLDHVMLGPDDVQSPRALHPIFYGSFDWHSCVHGFWLLARLRREFPALPERARIDALFRTALTGAHVLQECAYLDRPLSGTFERPYGWAWLLMLAAELRCGAVQTERSDLVLAPLAQALAGRLRKHLPQLTYPIRAGTHFNSAFALTLAHEYAIQFNDDELAQLIRARALDWFGTDLDCQAWEPGGDDFLSPALMEAACMRRILGHEEFLGWFARFLPRANEERPSTLFTPAIVTDRSDGKIAHLDGLNLSRAWCWRCIAGSFAAEHPLRAAALAAAERHLAASLPYLAVDYMGAHWLGSFAVLALTS